MKLNNKCAKAVLTIADTLDSNQTISFAELVNEINKSNHYPAEEIRNTCNALSNKGYLEIISKTNLVAQSPIVIRICSITDAGQKYLKKLRIPCVFRWMIDLLSDTSFGKTMETVLYFILDIYDFIKPLFS